MVCQEATDFRNFRRTVGVTIFKIDFLKIDLRKTVSDSADESDLRRRSFIFFNKKNKDPCSYTDMQM